MFSLPWPGARGVLWGRTLRGGPGRGVPVPMATAPGGSGAVAAGTGQYGASRLAGGPRRGDAIGQETSSQRSERRRSRAAGRRRARRGVSGARRGGGAAEVAQAAGGREGSAGKRKARDGRVLSRVDKDGESDEMCPSSSRSTE